MLEIYFGTSQDFQLPSALMENECQLKDKHNLKFCMHIYFTKKVAVVQQQWLF